MAVELELVVAADATLGGVSGAVTLEMATGIPGPNTVTTSTTTDLTGLLAGDGSTVGTVSLDGMVTLSIPGPVVAQTLPVFDYVAFPLTLVAVRRARVTAGYVVVRAIKNGDLDDDFDVTDSPVDVVYNVPLAVGDALSISLDPLQPSSGLVLTLIFRRTVE